MSGDDYLRRVLTTHHVPTGPGSTAHSVASAVAPALYSWADGHLTGKQIQFSGSYAKGTAVATGTDVDLFISLKQSAGTLKSIYDSLYQLAVNNGWSPRAQNVSIGITYAGEKIDLVPARVQPGVFNPHSLYLSKANSWTKTDIFKHINLVSNSGRIEEIKLTKIWRDQHGLDLPSIYLELTVLNALYSKKKGDVAANFLAVLEYLRDVFTGVRVVDPANTANILSDSLTAAEKTRIASQARNSRAEQYWEQVVC